MSCMETKISREHNSRRDISRKRAISFVLTILMLFGMMSGLNVNSYAGTGTITSTLDLTGTPVVTSGPGWNWDSSTKTIVLNGVSIQVPSTSSGDMYGLKLPAGTTITLATGSTNNINITGTESNTNSYGIYFDSTSTEEANIINGLGTLITNGGNATNRSVGIGTGNDGGSGYIEITGGIINATSGKAAVSYAINSHGNILIKDCEVTAISEDWAGNNYSAGIDTDNYDVTITNSTVEAIAGSSNKCSSGIMANHDIIITSSNVRALGGTALNDAAENFYYGSFGLIALNNNIIINSGDVTAIGGSAQKRSFGAYSAAYSRYLGGETNASSDEITATSSSAIFANSGISFGLPIKTYLSSPAGVAVSSDNKYIVTETGGSIPSTDITISTIDYNLSSITISGIAQVGQTLTAAVTPIGSTANYQWKSGGSNVGTDSTSYTIESGDLDKTITVTATGYGSYSGVVTSSATSAIVSNVWDGTSSTSLVGAGSAAYPYLISSGADLAYMRDRVNSGKTITGSGINAANVGAWSAYYKLTADIILNDGTFDDIGNFTKTGEETTSAAIAWVPISYTNSAFTGNFEGDGYKVSGIYINNAINALYNQGLFSVIQNATISNLGVVNSYIKANERVGGLVGTLSTILAYSTPSSIQNCYNSSIVIGASYVGGLVGKIEGGARAVLIEDCYNTGNITATSDRCVGGIVGYAQVSAATTTTIKNCYNKGSISGPSYVGGIIGWTYGMDSSTILIENCYNEGIITGIILMGGISGSCEVAATATTTITSCYNMGKIILTGISTYAGGISGFFQVDTGTSRTIIMEYCYNTGDLSVNAASQNGGLLGYQMADSATAAIIRYSYSAGSVSKGFSTYGILGRLGSSSSTSSIVASYYDNQISYTSSNTKYGTGYATTSMVGISLQGKLGDNAKWIFADGLYPRLASIGSTDAAYVSVTPVILATGNTAMNVSGSSLTLGAVDGLSWSSNKVSSISISGTQGTVTKKTTDTAVTLTASKGSSSRVVMLTVPMIVVSPETTPVATVDYTNYKIIGLVANANYTISGSAISADTDGKIAIDDEWYGKTVSIIKTGNGTSTSNSTAQNLVILQVQAAPTGLTGVAPTLSGRADGQITGASTLMQYKLSTNPSYISVTSVTITGLAAGTYNVRYAAKTGYAAGTDANVIVSQGNIAQSTPTGISAVAPTLYRSADGKITNTTTLMEYKLSTDTNYTAVTGTTITGLAAGTYNIRYAARDGYNVSGYVSVTVPEGQKITVYSISISGTAEVGQTLTAGLNPSNATVIYQWKSGVSNVGTNSSSYTVTLEDLDKTITVTATGTGVYTGTVSSAATSAVTLGNETDIFHAKFTKDQLFDVQRSPAFPQAGKIFRLSGLKAPYTQNYPSMISWASGDYVKFEYISKVSEMGVTTQNAIINSLKWYYSDVDTIKNAAVVKQIQYNSGNSQKAVISDYGIIWGLDNEKGFLYTALAGAYKNSGGIGTFVSFKPYAYNSIVSYIASDSGPVSQAGIIAKEAVATTSGTTGGITSASISGQIVDLETTPGGISGVTVVISYGGITNSSITDTEGQYVVDFDNFDPSDTKYDIKVTSGSSISGITSAAIDITTSSGFGTEDYSDTIPFIEEPMPIIRMNPTIDNYIPYWLDPTPATGLTVSVSALSSVQSGQVNVTVIGYESGLTYYRVLQVEPSAPYYASPKQGEWLLISAGTTQMALSNGNYIEAIVTRYDGIILKWGKSGVSNDGVSAEETPIGTVDYINNKIIGLVANANYTVSGSAVTANSSGEITIDNSWYGQTVPIVKTGNGSSTSNSTAQNLAILQLQAAPIGLAGVAPTSYGQSDGMITGTTTFMEYKLSSESTYTSVTGITITGLSTGTYNVRYAAKTGFNVGTDASVVVGIGANQSQAAPTGLAGVAPTSYGQSDGMITGTTTFMEYKLSSDSTYTSVTGITITGLSTGTYNVRYAAKTGFNVGTDASVIINAGQKTTVTAVTISGTAKIGETLTVSLVPNGSTVTYQWKSGGTNVGTDSTYIIQSADLGKKITVTVTGNGVYEGDVTSSETLAVSEADITSVNISGTAEVGRTLTAVTAPSGATATFQWKAGGSNVGTGSTYVVKVADIGKKITVVATATGSYAGTLTSSETSAVTVLATTGVLNAKFTIDQLFDVQRSPAFPIKERNFRLSGMKAAYMQNFPTKISWATGDYVKFEYISSVSEAGITSQNAIINSLRWYYTSEAGIKNAALVKQIQYTSGGSIKATVSDFGLIWAIDSEEGFLYTALNGGFKNSGGLGTFVSFKPYVYGSSTSYIPDTSDPLSLANIQSKSSVAVTDGDNAGTEQEPKFDISGKLVKDDGVTPIKGADITVTYPQGGTNVYTDITDDYGIFKLEIPLPHPTNPYADPEIPVISNYIITIEEPGKDPVSTEVVTSGGGITGFGTDDIKTIDGGDEINDYTDDSGMIIELIPNSPCGPGGIRVISPEVVSKYTISFNANGGDAATSITGAYGGEITLPSTTKTGYSFVGWYRDNQFSTSYTLSTFDAENITLYAKWQANAQVYTVDGSVKDSGDVIVSEASIKLMAGSRLVKQTTTNESGVFSVTGVPSGKYNLVISKGTNRTVTLSITVTNSNIATGVVTLPSGYMNSVVEVKPNTPDIIVENLNDFFNSGIFTTTDSGIVSEGGKVEIKLTVELKNESGANVAENLASIESEAGAGRTIGLFLNLTINKITTQGNSSPVSIQITELDQLLDIDIPLTEGQQGKSNYIVYRYHNGAVETITQIANSDGEYIELSADGTVLTLHVKKFSTYAIGYDDPEIPSSGSTPTISYSVTATAGVGGAISPTSTRIKKGSNKTFSITAIEGYSISDVLVDGKSVGTVSSYTFINVRSAHTIKAIFAKTDGSDNGDTGIDNNGYIDSFADVGINRWFYDAVEYAAEKGLMVGVKQNDGTVTFDPLNETSRGMIVTILYRLDGQPAVIERSGFSDVREGSWYDESIAWAAKNNIVNGYLDGTYGPTNNISRQELASILYRYSEYKGYNLTANDDLGSFTDATAVSNWALQSVEWAAGAKLISGITPIQLDARGFATRAQVAAVLMTFIKNES